MDTRKFDFDGSRLVALDGLRGIAILLVLIYHYCSRFPGYYPYGEAFINFGLYGFLGVQLFFVISGFVIALTLQRCSGMFDFSARRLARLWPPMLVCSLITFAFMQIIDTPFTEDRRVGIEGFLPSLTFIGPQVWRHVVEGAEWMDGAYWSLFVEVRFYFWAALIYFVFPRNFSLVLLWFSMLSVAGIEALPKGPLSVIWTLLFFPQHLPFFAVGAIFYDIWRGETKRWQWPGIAVLAAVCLYGQYAGSESLLLMFLVAMCFLPFVLLCIVPQALRPFEVRPLVWLGRRSYSLYLLHQNIGVALITLAASGLSVAAYGMTIGAVVLLMIFLAHMVFETVEKRSNKVARLLLSLTRRQRQAS